MLLKYELSLDIPQSFENEIISYLARKVGESCRRAIPQVKIQSTLIMSEGLKNAPEYDSLCNGVLRIELGLKDGSKAADGVVAAAISTLNASVIPHNGNILGGISVGIFSIGFKEALASADASYESKGTRYGPILIEWLNWLLFRGNERITVAEVLYGNFGPKISRTGVAIMDKSNKFGWSVPDQFSGTNEDNWFTRAGIPILPKIGEIMKESLGF